MKFGKRRKDADPPTGEPVVDATHDAPPVAVTESWTVPSEELPAHAAPGADEPSPPAVPEAPSYAVPDTPSYAPEAPSYAVPDTPSYAPEAPSYAVPEAPSYVKPEAVVEGEAVEIPADAQADVTPPVGAYESSATFDPPPVGAYEPPAPYVPPPPYDPPPPVPEPAAMPFPVAREPIAVVASGPSEHEAAVPLGAAAETFASGHGQDHGRAPAPAWPEGIQELVAERPEVLVGAAFAGGILFAMVLRRLGN